MSSHIFPKTSPLTYLVLFVALEAILHASLDRKSLSVERFSRWLRGLCTILLARNSPADRVKALGYVEQAVTVMGCNDAEQDENEVRVMVEFVFDK